MKKFALVLIVLMLAAPVMATVTITATESPANTWTVSFTSDEVNDVRAFALDVSVDSSATITSVTPVKIGESNSVSLGYGIFPSTIYIDGDGNVVDYNTPVTPLGAPDACDGLNTGAVTVELGSLYEDGNVPVPGDLFTFTVSGSCAVTMSENARRGGVVMENPDESVDVSFGSGPPPCFQAGMVDGCGYTILAADVTVWEGLGSPSSWCDKCHCAGDMNGDCVMNTTDLFGSNGQSDVDGWKYAFSNAGTDYQANCDTNYDGAINTTDLFGTFGDSTVNGWKFGFGLAVCPTPCP